MEGNFSNVVRSIFLIGDPIKHSISPQIHNAAFRRENIPYKYKTKQIKKKNLPDILEKFKTDGTVGFNVTIPYKTFILKYLDEITPIAQEIGAVNTVKIENGKLIGTNTDIVGIKKAITNANFRIKQDLSIVIIGAGGAARSVASYFSKHNVQLSIINRTLRKAENLCNDISNHPTNAAEFCSYVLDIPKIETIFQSADLLINATPVGMWPIIDENILLDYIPTSSQWVFDLVYNPIESQLVKTAKKNGCKLISGLDMLIYQASEAFKWWTGKNPDINLMNEVAIDYLSSISSK
ncbi:MAG: shikimate dehydrogenase [Promethearchaeota archaeon]